MGGRGRSYILFAAGLAAIVAGFWPSFFSNPLSNDAWYILHGVAATLWVLLLITQSFLIGRGNLRWHQRLGWLSSGLFATLLATVGYMIWVEVTGPEPFPAFVRQALVFLDILFLILFIALYALGLTFRGTPRLHARLMDSTILIGLGPALVRLYGRYLPQSWGMSGAVLLTFGTIEAILIVAIVLAFRRRQSVRPFPGLLAAFILIQIGLPWAMGSTFAGMLRAAGSPI